MIEGIQNLSRHDIELKSIEVIEYFDKSILKKPGATPVLEFAQKLQKEFNVIIDLTRDLGCSKNGGKILGMFVLKPIGIFIDNSIINDSRFNFTLAHEIGHLVLHRNLIFKQEEYENISDTEHDLLTGNHILKTERDWIEWQANSFASSFLMPKDTIRQAVVDIQEKLGMRNKGMIYLDKNQYSLSDFKQISLELQMIFMVNHTNIEFRLKDLGILDDQRLKDVQHISRLFREE